MVLHNPTIGEVAGQGESFSCPSCGNMISASREYNLALIESFIIICSECDWRGEFTEPWDDELPAP